MCFITETRILFVCPEDISRSLISNVRGKRSIVRVDYLWQERVPVPAPGSGSGFVVRFRWWRRLAASASWSSFPCQFISTFSNFSFKSSCQFFIFSIKVSFSNTESLSHRFVSLNMLSCLLLLSFPSSHVPRCEIRSSFHSLQFFT
jgi:hypothetical protein